MNAVEHGYLEVVKFLIKKGANVKVQDLMGETALMHAVKCDNLTRSKSVNCGWSDWIVLWDGSLEVVEFLIENGASVDVQDKNGWTVLMYAAWTEKNLISNPKCQQKLRKIIDLLFAAKANPLLKAKDGTTVLEQGNSETVKECMRQQICGILVEEVASELSLVFPLDLAKVIAKLTH